MVKKKTPQIQALFRMRNKDRAAGALQGCTLTGMITGKAYAVTKSPRCKCALAGDSMRPGHRQLHPCSCYAMKCIRTNFAAPAWKIQQANPEQVLFGLPVAMRQDAPKQHRKQSLRLTSRINTAALVASLFAVLVD